MCVYRHRVWYNIFERHQITNELHGMCLAVNLSIYNDNVVRAVSATGLSRTKPRTHGLEQLSFFHSIRVDA